MTNVYKLNICLGDGDRSNKTWQSSIDLVSKFVGPKVLNESGVSGLCLKTGCWLLVAGIPDAPA